MSPFLTHFFSSDKDTQERLLLAVGAARQDKDVRKSHDLTPRSNALLMVLDELAQQANWTSFDLVLGHFMDQRVWENLRPFAWQLLNTLVLQNNTTGVDKACAWLAPLLLRKGPYTTPNDVPISGRHLVKPLLATLCNPLPYMEVEQLTAPLLGLLEHRDCMDLLHLVFLLTRKIFVPSKEFYAGFVQSPEQQQ